MNGARQQHGDASDRPFGEARRHIGPGLIIAAAVGVLALPSAVLAFSSRFDVAPDDSAANHGLGGFAPGSVDPRLASAIAAQPAGKSALFRFTPAGLAARPDRLVTVVQRIDSETARSIVVRASLPRDALAANVTPLRIAPTAYALGLAHGYQNFAIGTQPAPVADLRAKFDSPEVSGFTISDGSDTGAASRLAPHILLNERDRAGSAPRTLQGNGEQSVDLGGSYRLTHNLDVTAGLRYSEDRDRLKSLNDGKQDDQAVFVGTQFHF